MARLSDEELARRRQERLQEKLRKEKERFQRKQQAKLENIKAYKEENIAAIEKKAQKEAKLLKEKKDYATQQEQIQLRKEQRAAIRKSQATKRKQYGRFQKALSKVSLVPKTSPAGRARAVRALGEGEQFRIFGMENSTVINPTKEKLRFYSVKKDEVLKKSQRQMRWL